MNIQESRGDPGNEEEGRGTPWKAASTPNDHPPETLMADSYGKANTDIEQETADCAPFLEQREMFHRRPVLWDSGWGRDGRFNVRLRLLGATDGGARRRWAESTLYAVAKSDSESHTEDTLDG